MGFYNSQFFHQVPAPLNQNQCFICDSAITPHNKTPDQDSFQYNCDNCKPNATIAVSGSFMLSDSYSKLLADKSALREVQKRMRQTAEDFFVTEEEVSKQIR